MLPRTIHQHCLTCQKEAPHLQNLARIELMKAGLSIGQQATHADEIFSKEEVLYFKCESCKTVSFKAK